MFDHSQFARCTGASEVSSYSAGILGFIGQRGPAGGLPAPKNGGDQRSSDREFATSDQGIHRRHCLYAWYDITIRGTTANSHARAGQRHRECSPPGERAQKTTGV